MSEEKYIPKSKFGQWFDSRLPLLSLSQHLRDYPTPKNLNYWWTFGAILTFCLIIQIITGLVLAMHYVAHVDLAFESVEHIMRDVNYGWLIRYVHSNGASMFFLAVYIHIFRSLFYGSYKFPRELIWIIGMLIYILMMATAFMGYVLPWGQMSFWAATVITSLFSAIPLFGESVVTWLWGGYAVGNPTLTRFYSLHYLMPFLIFGLVILHIWALHIPGNNNPNVPSMHFNTRFICTQKSWFGGGIDITPCLKDNKEKKIFHNELKKMCDVHNKKYYLKYKKWCDRYFYLPHRGETRGIGGIFFDYKMDDWKKDFAFVKDVGNTFTYMVKEITEKKMFKKWTKKEKEIQLLKRGRYVEFNLLYDRGTKFGLNTGGNPESILMSMPPTAKWK